jgi:hypothetical protein
MEMKNWRTTVAGILTAAVYGAFASIQAGEIEPKTIAVAAGIAALGYFSKDAGVSGTEK